MKIFLWFFNVLHALETSFLSDFAITRAPRQGSPGRNSPQKRFFEQPMPVLRELFPEVVSSRSDIETSKLSATIQIRKGVGQTGTNEVLHRLHCCLPFRISLRRWMLDYVTEEVGVLACALVFLFLFRFCMWQFFRHSTTQLKRVLQKELHWSPVTSSALPVDASGICKLERFQCLTTFNHSFNPFQNGNRWNFWYRNVEMFTSWPNDWIVLGESYHQSA